MLKEVINSSILISHLRAGLWAYIAPTGYLFVYVINLSLYRPGQASRFLGD
jgi:hypothetical protein